MDREVLRNYARLIARSGVNVMPGQQVVIRTEPCQLDFVEMLTEECYKAGAGKVSVEFEFQRLVKMHVAYQSAEQLGTVEQWEQEKLKFRSETLPAMIYLDSADPDGLNGIDHEKHAKARQLRYPIVKPWLDAMENKYQWCIAAVPGIEWARKVFPEMEEANDEDVLEELWQAILRCARADGPDPVETWRQHSEELHRRCAWLNSLKLRRLHYRSEKTGTDFTVGLLPQMLFCGGSEKLEGHELWYNPNIPSEEVFTSPRAGDAEGVVYATRPLSYRGLLIEDFSFRFEKGRVVEVHAGKNEEALRTMVAMDEGASMLGECALVPYASPIRESGILFYNTLFDENAACHLALGEGFSSCLDHYEEYTLEQARALGVNDSMIHEDFMIGSEDLCITGVTEDGRKVPIFVNGGWAQA